MSSNQPTATYTIKFADFSISTFGTLDQIKRISDDAIWEIYNIFLELKTSHKEICCFKNVIHSKYIITFSSHLLDNQEKYTFSEKINFTDTVEVRVASYKQTKLPKKWIFLRD